MNHQRLSRGVGIGILAAGVLGWVFPATAAVPQTQTRAALLAEADLAAPVSLPRPEHAVFLPDDTDGPITIRLSQAVAGQVSVRRVSAGDGRLYLEIRADGLSGTAEIARGEHIFQQTIANSLWLSLKPKIGRVTIDVTAPGMKKPVDLVAPTTLVEIRGRQIFVNGEPFLIKGAMSRDLTQPDAAYIHSLGMNTLRGKEALADCERYGFMSITSLNLTPTSKQIIASGSDAEFESSIEKTKQWLKENSAAAVASPNALILQLGNEKTGAGGKPPGAEPLTRARRRVSQLLAAAYDVAKSLSPMLPVGYANQDLGFLAPDRMDVYMHNSFLSKDRYRYPWDDFMRWQGCLPPDGKSGQGRPFVNSEFGANRYLCQSYHGGPNNPFLEKIHAWNMTCRWTEFMEHQTAGGAIYCLYDLKRPTDQGCSRFGILTDTGKPKLACWNIEHVFRDFELRHQGKNLAISFKRDYWARDCRLTLTGLDGEVIHRRLDDFAPESSRRIPLDGNLSDAKGFRWQMDFTTHSGLPSQACGAWPDRIEEQDFLNRLADRDTYPFLRELFDAKVETASGKPAPLALAEMTGPDGIIPVALQKPNGVTYLLLIAREKPNEKGPLKDGITIDVAFRGKVEQVDDMTGKPLAKRVDAVAIPSGLRLKNVQAARIPKLIHDRSDTPFELPVYRISP